MIVLSNGENFYKQYINGDDCAFEYVLSYYYEGLVYFISRYTHSVFDAEEIANDCFLYIAIHKNKYNFKTSLKTYLYTIGRSRALNFLRKNKKSYTVYRKSQIASLLWSCLDDNKRLGIRHYGSRCLFGYSLDEGYRFSLSCRAMDSVYSGKDPDSDHSHRSS